MGFQFGRVNRDGDDVAPRARAPTLGVIRWRTGCGHGLEADTARAIRLRAAHLSRLPATRNRSRSQRHAIAIEPVYDPNRLRPEHSRPGSKRVRAASDTPRVDAANVIALVGIVTTGAVGITAQILGFRREAATQQHTERLQKNTEARAVLDGALATAYEARAALDDYAEALVRLSAQTLNFRRVHHLDEHIETAHAAASSALAKLRLDASRLIVRFGHDDIVYASYASVLLAYVDLLGHTENFHTDLKLASAGQQPQSEATAEMLADVGRHLDRLVFSFADHAHQWASRD